MFLAIMDLVSILFSMRDSTLELLKVSFQVFTTYQLPPSPPNSKVCFYFFTKDFRATSKDSSIFPWEARFPLLWNCWWGSNNGSGVLEISKFITFTCTKYCHSHFLMFVSYQANERCLCLQGQKPFFFHTQRVPKASENIPPRLFWDSSCKSPGTPWSTIY